MSSRYRDWERDRRNSETRTTQARVDAGRSLNEYGGDRARIRNAGDGGGSNGTNTKGRVRAFRAFVTSWGREGRDRSYVGGREA